MSVQTTALDYTYMSIDAKTFLTNLVNIQNIYKSTHQPVQLEEQRLLHHRSGVHLSIVEPKLLT